MVTNLNWACPSACAYSTGLQNVSITPSNYPRQIEFLCLEVIISNIRPYPVFKASLFRFQIKQFILLGAFERFGAITFKTSTERFQIIHVQYSSIFRKASLRFESLCHQNVLHNDFNFRELKHLGDAYNGPLRLI